MLCNGCENINFQRLLTHDRKSGFYILHHSRASYWRALAKRCALCTLISSQLGEVALQDSVCEQLEAFMVLKRRWLFISKLDAISIHSQLGFGTLKRMDTLPVQYQEILNREGGAADKDRKRKRDQIEGVESPGLVSAEHSNDPGNPFLGHISSHHTGSPENMRLARHWIKDCLEQHEICAQRDSHHHTRFVPTRLVDTHDPNRPLLLTKTDALGTDYIALSYAWGNGERFTTTKKNFKDHQNYIPLRSAPKTFTHAFQVTRELGYRYIWIDALCIIQNDSDDLEQELAKMGEIYRHATFTVSAEGAPSVFGGLFQQRDPYLYRPCVIDVKTTSEESVTSERLTLGTIVTGENYLKKRGWILQEEVLSSRCLSFGKQMRWRCTVSEASETRPAPRSLETALTHGRGSSEDRLKLWLYAPARMSSAPREKWSQWSRYESWYSTIEEYSTKSLTNTGDQLRALSGLADLFGRAHNVTYVAGLWWEDLQLGLAWYVASNDPRPVTEARKQRPSWSFASVGMVRIKFRAWPAFSTHVVSDGAEIVDASCNPAHEANPVGGVVDGFLKLRARVKKLRLCWSAEYTANRTEFSYGSYSGPETTTMTKGEHPRFAARVFDLRSNHFVGEAALDRPMRSRPRTETEDVKVCCALLHVQKTPDSPRFTALILEDDASEPMTYRRLGLLFPDEKYERETPFSSWDIKDLHIL